MKVFLILITLFLLACSGDEGTAPATTFAVAIDNRVATSYDVYHATAQEGPWKKIGHALSGMTYWIRGLDTGVTHYLRLVPPGSAADQFHFERSATSTGADVVWVVR
ncbi:MAG: hypothetical protein M5R41_15810 [Bacteroidia bacterium]|nr:hypothetical protein [Bacteroidia bacterium]